MLHAVLFTPDDALADETGSTLSCEEAFGADCEEAPFCAEDAGELGGGLDLGIIETEGYALSNALFRV